LKRGVWQVTIEGKPEAGESRKEKTRKLVSGRKKRHQTGDLLR